MKQKRKVVSAFLFLLLLCCACKKGDGVSVKSWGGCDPDAGVRISAELLSEKTVDVQTPFEVKVSIGNSGVYSTGILEIKAPGFEITDAAGATHNDVYTRQYEEFKEGTYGYRIEDETFRGLKYSENIQLKYIGEAENGEIAFWISGLQYDEEASEEEQKYGAAVVGLFYSVKDGKITLTTERPLEEGSPLLNEVPADDLAENDGVTESDGVIGPMESEELDRKLSALKFGMSLEEMSKLFGKEPFTVVETDSDVYQYYSGDITITLWGRELYQATVEYEDSRVRIALDSEVLIKTGEDKVE